MKAEAKIVLRREPENEVPCFEEDIRIADMQNVTVIEEFFSEQRNPALLRVEARRNDGNAGITLALDDKWRMSGGEDMPCESIPCEMLKKSSMTVTRSALPIRVERVHFLC